MTRLPDASTETAADVPAKYEAAALKAVPAASALPYLHIILDRTVRYAAVVAAAVALSGLLLSPMTARAEQNTNVLTSQRPWLAPVGHRQPRRADVPHDKAFTAREREQLRKDRELDRSLMICRC
jgi:hypothetical protein